MSKLFSHLAPVLPVDNIGETTAFYRDKLGFDVAFTWGDPPYYAVVKRDESVGIHFSEREDTTVMMPACMVYIFVNDVDAVYEEYLKNGLDIFSPPENQDYGMREFELKDLNGHFLIFGQGV